MRSLWKAMALVWLGGMASPTLLDELSAEGIAPVQVIAPGAAGGEAATAEPPQLRPEQDRAAER